MTEATDISLLKTMTVFRTGLLRERVNSANFNLIACGASRGGTSSIGALMSYFNFTSGGQVHPTTHEDLEFTSLVSDQPRNSKLPDLIHQRNQDHPGWSIKLPWALIGCEIFEQHSANPIFFVMVRNPMSIALSLSKRDERFANDILSGFDHVQHFYHGGIRALRGVSSPIVICEYEKTLADPRAYVTEFIELFNIQSTPEKIEAAIGLISEKGYKAVEAGNEQV